MIRRVETFVKVTYVSGRSEIHQYSSRKAAYDAIKKFEELPTVKAAHSVPKPKLNGGAGR